MRYTYAIEQAIRAASVLHKGQVRKGLVPYPYITHLFAVAMIVSDYTDDEDTIVTALLHDTLEDTDYTPAELEDDFGGDIKDLILSITDSSHTSADKKEELDLQKKYFKQLKGASEKALVVLSADLIHTMRSIVEEYFDNPSEFIAEFGVLHDEKLYYYQEVSNALNRKLRNEILSEFNNVFTEYKNFINDVKAKSEEY